MPQQIIKSPGDTEQRATTSTSNSDWNTVHGRDGTSSVNLQAASAGNRLNQARIAGANYVIARGVIAYDFRTANLPRGIKIIRAQLVVGGTATAAGDTNGDKIRIGVIADPTNPGEVSIAATDYDLARYDVNSYTSAQSVPNASINVVVNLDNRALLNHLSKTINRRGVLHLGVRNELDFLDDPSNVTGLNRAWFNMPSRQGNSVKNMPDVTLAQLRIFYRIIGQRRNPGGRGAGGVASSGFGGVSMFCGTNSGFSS
jgi:hypothetical protein